MSEATTEAITPEPGIYEGVPFDEYGRWRAVNNSSLGPMLISPAHYRAAKESAREETDAMRFGTLVHSGKLDPKDLIERYVVMPAFELELCDEDGNPKYKNPRNTNEYRELKAKWEEANKGKTVVGQAEYDEMKLICVRLYEDDLCRECLNHDGPAEVSILWRDPETGLLCKGRVDKIDHKRQRTVDLKTCRSVAEFPKDFARRGYHRQAAFYQDGLRELLGKTYEPWLVAAETTDPFPVAAAPVDGDALVYGRMDYRKALRQIAECRETDHYPFAPAPGAWTLPGWMQPELTITGGFGSFTF